MSEGAPEETGDVAALRKEMEYYRTRLDDLAGQAIRADSVVSRAKRELKQRRQGFALLTELHQRIATDMEPEQIFCLTLERLEKQLKMDRSVVLRREEGSETFVPCFSTGFPNATAERLRAMRLDLPLSFLEARTPLLVTQATPAEPFGTLLKSSLETPFFVCTPISAGENTDYYLLSGRMREAKPFFPPLDEGDVYTIQSIAGFLGAALHNAALFAHTQRMARSFARFVPTEFLEFLSRRSIVDVELGDQTQQVMTVLFSDIRSFTTLSEQMTPEQTFRFINSYLNRVAPVIQEHGGFIDKFIGDAIMALFPGDPVHAIRAAQGLQSAVEGLNAELALTGQPPVSIGVGLNTGLLMLGTIGFADRMESTVISDAVNLASRMEGLTKHYHAFILLTGETLQAANLTHDEGRNLRRIDRVTVKGKTEPIDVYELFGSLPEPELNLRRGYAPTFARGFALWCDGEFDNAATVFQCILAGDPTDPVAALHLARCRQMASEAPRHDWSGVTVLDHK